MTSTLLVATIGALTGCCSLAWNIFTWWHAGARLKVTASPNIVSTDAPDKQLIFVVVSNNGSQPATLRTIAVRRAPRRLRRRDVNETEFFIPDPNPGCRLPHIIRPGEQWQAMIMQAAVVAAFNERGWPRMQVTVYHSAARNPVTANVNVADCKLPREAKASGASSTR